ncbi:cyclophilin-like fold protein [Sporolactobacillus shoreicorticis]|uniref:Cyclophilin-like fold protein n=1 Tax=Sporolactobacillus shoreicorticis TaxID=1923877 RepID=A0ABW5RYU8_9BACL|nr:cyclophilin-like fold protein [Sporolactobacillus shoreicorticis]MCO7127924.1 cyclophilin-like fold protein [Sporolactobacillus shoreicorticis]
MKKFVIAAILLFPLLLSACGSNASSDQKSNTKPSTASQKSSNSANTNETDSKRSGKTAIVTIDGKTFEMDLYDNASAQALITAMPIKITASRWGDGEYYGKIPKSIPSDGKKIDLFDVGEIGLWPAGNSFCIFFGPTPVSEGNQPKMDSPGIPLGKITSDVSALRSMDSSVTITVKLK